MKYKSFFISTALFFMAAVGLLADPTIKESAIGGHAGTYSVDAEVVFSFTLSNTTKTVTANPNQGLSQAEATAINNANTANSVTVTGNLIGTDIYGNPVEVPISTSGGNKIAPESSLELEGRVRIPKDGSFHKLSEGYSISLEYTYTHTPVGGSTITEGPFGLSSTSGILVDVPANLKVVDLAYPVKTYRGGDIIEITATIRNETPNGSTTIVRPLTALEDFRTEFHISDDASIDRGNDFLLGFFESAGNLSYINGRTQVRALRVTGTPETILDYTRDYTPQPDDGFLDVGESIIVTLEVLIPTNYTGTFFASAYTDSLGDITELEEDVDATFGDQGDNVYVDSFTPLIRIASTTAPDTLPVSEVSDGNGGMVAASDGASDNPSMSEDGVWIAFQSSATNLDPDLAGSGNFNIYLRNRETEEVILISRNNTGLIANRDCYNPSISADGRYIAYESLATNLASDPQGAGSQIYVYDRESTSTTRISKDAGGLASNGSCYTPSISENGRFIVYESLATNLDANFESILTSTLAVQAFVHDRGLPDEFGEFGDNFATYLVSTYAGIPADNDVVTPKISLDGRVVAFTSAASNLGVVNNGYVTQIWSRELDENGVPINDTVLVSRNAAGTAGGNRDSSEPAVNGGPSADYGLQIAFASIAEDLIANDTNGIADIFVRDYSTPGSPITVRESVSNPRVAYGSIEFYGPVDEHNIPDNQPDIGDTVTLNDGVNTPVTFTFVSFSLGGQTVEIGTTTSDTRDNLVAAINATADLDIVAYASDPATASFNYLDLDGQSPSIELFNIVPGEQGNQSIGATYVVPPVDFFDRHLVIDDMSQGGTETGYPVDVSLGNPGGLVYGSLQPSLDRSGRIVAFRSLVGGISVVRDGARVFKPLSPTESTPRVGEVIRPLNPNSSNIYFRNRDLSESGTLDQVGNTDTSRASVNKFGYRTNQLLDTADSASSRMPALSANGRFIAFASDATNTGGLRFDRTNRQPLDSNNLRDVFIYDRNIVVPTVVIPRKPTVTITSPTAGDTVASNSGFYVTANAIGYDAETEAPSASLIESVKFFINGEYLAEATEEPFVVYIDALDIVAPVEIFARAEDINGLMTSSPTVEIIAEDLGAEPDVEFVTATEDVTIEPAVDLPLEATAQVAGGEVQSLEFWYRTTLGDPLLGTQIQGNAFSSAFDGTFYIYAVATSTTGVTGTTASPIVVTVASPPFDLSVEITSDVSVDSVVIGDTKTFSANATATVGVASVEWYVNDALVETATIEPYSFTHTFSSSGVTYIRAQGIDARGRTASDTTAITVALPNPVLYDPDFVSYSYFQLTGATATEGQVNDALANMDGSIDQRVAFLEDFFESRDFDESEMVMLVYRTMTGEWPNASELEVARAGLYGSTAGAGAQSGSIDAGETETYQFTYNSGDAVTIRVTADASNGDPLTDPTLTVNSPSGAFVADSDDSFFSLNPLVNFTATEAGSYSAIVGGWPTLQSGDFTITSFTTNSGTTGNASAEALVQSLIPEFEDRFDLAFPTSTVVLGLDASSLVTQLFINKHGSNPDSNSLVRLQTALTGDQQALGGVTVPGYNGNLSLYTASFALDNTIGRYAGLTNVNYYGLPNNPEDEAPLAIMVATFLGVDPTDEELSNYDGMTQAEAFEDILTDPRFTDQFPPEESDLPEALSEAVSLGEDWYYLDWFGYFAFDGSSDNWVYSLDFGWISVASSGTTEQFWFWSDSLSSWLWASEANPSYFYHWSYSSWVYVLSVDGGGAWLNNLSTGNWERVTP